MSYRYGRFGDEWADPYSQPPLVQATVIDEGAPGDDRALTSQRVYDTATSAREAAVSGGSGTSFVDSLVKLTGGLVDIFGRRVTPPPTYTPPKPAVPSWVLPVGIGLVGVVAVTLLARRGSKRAVAGYRRRRSRR